MALTEQILCELRRADGQRRWTSIGALVGSLVDQLETQEPLKQDEFSATLVMCITELTAYATTNSINEAMRLLVLCSRRGVLSIPRIRTLVLDTLEVSMASQEMSQKLLKLALGLNCLDSECTSAEARSILQAYSTLTQTASEEDLGIVLKYLPKILTLMKKHRLSVNRYLIPLLIWLLQDRDATRFEVGLKALVQINNWRI